jgi:hypothetical protein
MLVLNSSQVQLLQLPAPFFIVPDTKYEYDHPEGSGHESSPFFSIWIVWLGQQHTRTIQHWWEKTLSKQKCSSIKLLKTTEELQQNHAIPTWKRPNPRQRSKIKQKAWQQE